MVDLVMTRQDDICRALTAIDGSHYCEDIWDRPGGGGGRTRIIKSHVYEKAGVNTSLVHGTLTENDTPLFQSLVTRVVPQASIRAGDTFLATGISLVIHPRHPHIPTVHANYRYFELTPLNGPSIWWVGGGADLTPYYIDAEDIGHFHRTHYTVCEAYQSGSYATFKADCDAYFYLPHRQETRGVGGIFFDDLHDDFDALYAFISQASDAFTTAYIPIVQRHLNQSHTDHERRWQCLRRGRYAEFNLLYDRGTLFGLKTNGRIESILMSMPPEAHWDYAITPPPHTPEAALIAVLQSPQDWVTP